MRPPPQALRLMSRARLSRQAMRTLSVLATTTTTTSPGTAVTSSSWKKPCTLLDWKPPPPRHYQSSVRRFSSPPPKPPGGPPGGGMQLPPWMTGQQPKPGEYLELYTNNLTEMAAKAKLDPIIGRHEEIRRCLQILARRTKNSE